MTIFLVFFALSGQLATPDAVTRLAFLDVHDATPAEDRRYTRYLSVHAAPSGDRPVLRKVVTYAANATSFRSGFGTPKPVGDLLLKLDLRDYGWDYPARSKRLRELERRGADFRFKDVEARRLFLDPWEALGRLDPYFEANHYDAAGHLVIGWIDPAVTNAIRQETYSRKPVLRADWVIGKLLTEKSFGGIYADLLMHPPREADGYKALLIDIEAANRDNQLRQGGAVLASTVALNNRELRLTYNPYPLGGGYYWETDDFNSDERGDKSVLERFAGGPSMTAGRRSTRCPTDSKLTGSSTGPGTRRTWCPSRSRKSRNRSSRPARRGWSTVTSASSATFRASGTSPTWCGRRS